MVFISNFCHMLLHLHFPLSPLALWQGSHTSQPCYWVGWREVWKGWAAVFSRPGLHPEKGASHRESSRLLLLLLFLPSQGTRAASPKRLTCQWGQVSVTEQRPQNKALPVHCSKYNCGRSIPSHESESIGTLPTPHNAHEPQDCSDRQSATFQEASIWVRFLTTSFPSSFNNKTCRLGTILSSGFSIITHFLAWWVLTKPAHTPGARPPVKWIFKGCLELCLLNLVLSSICSSHKKMYRIQV